MKTITASRGASKRIPLHQSLPFLILITLLTACSGRSSSVDNLSTSTPPAPWAYAEIAKPTYTPLPTLAPTSTPPPENLVDLPIDSRISAEIVPDTPMPGYSAAQQVQANVQPSTDGAGKYILVDISEQHLYAYEGDTLVFSFVASTGMNNATRLGAFSVLDKIPNAYGATWNIWMPNWLGIYYSGHLENGIHALPILPNGTQLWAGFLGRPISYGCVVLGADEAQMLYDWADVGTPVEIQW
jgi:lipoprotein-anchoring transpeptidase ErfK/SrfK